MMTPDNNQWRCAVELSPDSLVTAGSFADLAEAVGRGADLRLYTEFLHEEHVAPGSTTPGIADERNHGLIRESIDFRQAMLVGGTHVVGATLLRQPLEPTTGFNGTRPMMSFFMYNMTGEQSHANVALDGTVPTDEPGSCRAIGSDPAMPKMRDLELFDAGTLAPSRNFFYAFERFRFFVRDDWTEVLAHDADGNVLRGSIGAVERAQVECREFKVAIGGLSPTPGGVTEVETFVNAGSGFFHTRRKFHESLSHPVLRVRPVAPMKLGSGRWDVCWVALRTDGQCVVRRLDPYTRVHSDRPTRLACRWFVR